MFWLLSTPVIIAAALLVAWPLLRRESSMKPTGLVLIFLFPVLIVMLYQGVGSPESLKFQPQESAAMDGDFDALTSTLRAKLEESPDNVEGWILLGRSYKSVKRYDEAVDALERAIELAPDNPLVKVEWVEARMFASGNPVMTPEMVATLQQAVDQDPGLQKGLWLLGIASVQEGDDVTALGYWQQLMSHVEPDSPVARTVSEQIGLAQQRLGISPGGVDPSTLSDPVTNVPHAREGLTIRVEYTAAKVASGSVLFIIARTSGMESGPPLAVRRIDQPAFPIDLVLDDSHSMIPQRKLSAAKSVSITARLSLQGQPQAQAGDWQSETLNISTLNQQQILLQLNQKIE